MSDPRVIAVDGGASKTDLVVVQADGTVLARARGRGSNPDHIGIDACVEVIAGLHARAAATAGAAPQALYAAYVLAGADTPEEERVLQEVLSARGWSGSCLVRNDTFGVLRAGTDRGWGVAVVCGAGINAVGVAPDGREVRFPALGPLSGDWGGGLELGLAAVGAANRVEDGRGPDSVLGGLVPAYFGRSRASDVAGAVHRKELEEGRLAELAPVVLEASNNGDGVARRLVERLAQEVVDLVRASLSRLALDEPQVDVVLGGGLLQARNRVLDDLLDEGIAAIAPQARVIRPTAPPIAGAALLALDALGAADGAEAALLAYLGNRSDGDRRPVGPMGATDG